MIEAISYRSSMATGDIKLSEIRSPYCQVLMSEFGGTAPAPMRVRFHPTFTLEADRPPMRRHYGGTNPGSNGTNWLFADLHVAWHSMSAARSQLYCCRVMAAHPRWGPTPDYSTGALEARCGPLPTSRRQ